MKNELIKCSVSEINESGQTIKCSKMVTIENLKAHCVTDHTDIFQTLVD
jgi:hypothetical protein